jgi:L-lactate dehydrogenase complex protein LldE
MFYPRVGIATLELLERLGQEVVYPDRQTCCGQPLANSGAEHDARAIYRHFVSHFQGVDYIVTPSGSCAFHVREHYDILPQDDAVKAVRERTFELCEFLTDILKVEDLNIYFPHKVGIHMSCHGLRMMHLGKPTELMIVSYNKVRQLIEKSEGIEIITLDREDECCGFGGTFAIFEPDVSVRMGKDRIRDHEKNGAEYITATDSSCLMHIEGILRRENRSLKVIHVAEILNSTRL